MSKAIDSTVNEGTEPFYKSGELFGHPKGLYILFLTEMWERFSYYGMRGLLMLYLTQHFFFSDKPASGIYASYIALVYVLTFIGGPIADRYLGASKAVIYGAILLIVGHFGMAFEGEQSKQSISYDGQEYALEFEGRGKEDLKRFLVLDGTRHAFDFQSEKNGDGVSESYLVFESIPVGLPEKINKAEFEIITTQDQFYVNIFYLSLAFIIMGVGFLKANVSTIVGSLYQQNDPRRDGGFTIFYMGINLGSFLASITVGIIGIKWGWNYGFGLAGIGMVFGLLVFVYGKHLLEGRGDPPCAEELKEKKAGISKEWRIYLGGLGGVFVCWQLLHNLDIIEYLMNGMVLTMLSVVIGYSIMKCEKQERDRLLVALFLILCQIPFWALFEQAGSSVTLLTERAVDRTLFGMIIPTPVFQSLNAAFIFLLAPFFAMMWVALSKRGWEPSTPTKFGLGVLQVGLGFLVLAFGMQLSGVDGMTAMIWIVLLYLIHTTGELCLSPVGLSMVTKLSVPKIVGMMMGAWFLISGFANYVSGYIAKATSSETVGGEITDLAAAKATYVDVYTDIGIAAAVISLVIFALTPILKKHMHGVH